MQIGGDFTREISARFCFQETEGVRLGLRHCRLTWPQVLGSSAGSPLPALTAASSHPSQIHNSWGKHSPFNYTATKKSPCRINFFFFREKSIPNITKAAADEETAGVYLKSLLQMTSVPTLRTPVSASHGEAALCFSPELQSAQEARKATSSQDNTGQ